MSPGRRVSCVPEPPERKMSFEDFTGLMYTKAGAVYSKLDELSHEERIQRMSLLVGVLFVVLNVLWIWLVR